MPFTKGQPEDLSNLRDMAYGVGESGLPACLRG